jgi:hypothetical protein
LIDGHVGAGADSLTPRQATYSPLIAAPGTRARSSSEPKRASAGVAMSVCTPMAIGTPPQLMSPSASAKAAA